MTIKKDAKGNAVEATATQKPELSNLSVSGNGNGKKVEQAVLTINQRLEKLSNLKNLAEKREKLVQTKEKLDSFKVSSDNNTIHLTIEDAHGENFETSNSSVLVDVLALIKKVVDNQVNEVEAQITF